MKTTLRLISLGLVCSLAVSLAADVAHLPVPAVVNPWHLFLAFVAVMALQTLVFDYASAGRRNVTAAARTVAPVVPMRARAQAPHALAA
jgi:hypothetical protein